MRLDSIKLKPRLIGAFLIVAGIAAVIGVKGLAGMALVKAAQNELATVHLPSVRGLNIIRAGQIDVRLTERTMINGDVSEADKLDQIQRQQASFEEIQRGWDMYEPLPQSADEKIVWQKFVPAFEKWKATTQETASLVKSGDLAAATKLSFTRGRDDYNSVKALRTQLIEINVKNADAAVKAVDKAATSSRRMIIAFIIVGVLMGLGLGLFIALSVANPVKQLAGVADKMALGDVDVSVEARGKDEIADLMRAMGAMVENTKGQAAAAEKIAAGDLSIEVKMASDKDLLAKSMIAVVTSLRDLVSEVGMLSKTAVEGKLETRGDASKFQGGYHDIVQGVNDCLDAVITPVNEATGVLVKLADNDLTARVTGDYQGDHAKIKDSLNTACSALEAIIIQAGMASSSVANTAKDVASTAAEVGKASQSVAETINQVASGSQEQTKMVTSASSAMEQLSQAIEEVAKGAQSQAKTVEDTVSLVQQINSAIESVATTSQSAAGASLEVADVAKSGGDSVGKSIAGMARIKETTSNVASAVVQLGESSKQIGAIVETIDDIAEQTNLLALNAAIEAARAGEHGKGFAVVADEVRKLAERSSLATKEIADLIGKIQRMTEHAVEAMQAGTSEVEQGTVLANEAGEALGSIVAAVNSIVQQIEDVSAATEEMSAQSAEVAKAVESLSAVTEESTAATEEMAATASEVTKSVEQVAAVSEENAAAAEEVSAAAQEQNASVEEMSASAGEVSKIAEDLMSVVSQFKVNAGATGSGRVRIEESPMEDSTRKSA